MEHVWVTDRYTKWGYHIVVVLLSQTEDGVPCMATVGYGSSRTMDLVTGDYLPKVDGEEAIWLAPRVGGTPALLRGAMRHVAQKFHLLPSKVAWWKEVLVCLAWQHKRSPYLYRTYRPNKDVVLVIGRYCDHCPSPEF